MPNRFQVAVAKAAPVATREFTLDNIFVGSDKPVVLHLRHAGFTNPGATSTSLKLGAEIRKNAEIKDPHERLIANEKLNAKTYAHSIVSWDNVIENGVAIPCTPETAEELLLALVDNYLDLFERVKNYASNDERFVEIPLGDPSDLGK